jgi:hypothetical protein
MSRDPTTAKEVALSTLLLMDCELANDAGEVILSSEDNAELDNLPPDANKLKHPLAKGQYDLRLKIAQKLCRSLVTVKLTRRGTSDLADSDVFDRFRRLHNKYPMWALYADQGAPRRVISIRLYVDGSYSVACVAPAAGGELQRCTYSYSAAETAAGAAAPHLRQVDAWDDAQKMAINDSTHPSVFYDPIGFIGASCILEESGALIT